MASTMLSEGVNQTPIADASLDIDMDLDLGPEPEPEPEIEPIQTVGVPRQCI